MEPETRSFPQVATTARAGLNARMLAGQRARLVPRAWAVRAKAAVAAVAAVEVDSDQAETAATVAHLTMVPLAAQATPLEASLPRVALAGLVVAVAVAVDRDLPLAATAGPVNLATMAGSSSTTLRPCKGTRWLAHHSSKP